MTVRLTGKIAAERIAALDFPRPDQDIIDAFKTIGCDTSMVSDVMDKLGLVGAVGASDLVPTIHGQPIVGPAITVKHEPLRGDDNPNQRAAAGFNGMAEMEAHNLAQPGDVVVIQGVAGLSNMGGVSSTIAQRQGIVGAIVDGGIRDLNLSREIGFPKWATEISPITGKWRIQTTEINGPVNVCGLRINPGDLIVADDTGVCVVPIEHARAVADGCLKMFNLEARRLEAIAAGAHIADLPKA
ncbi:RraA family protein [Aquamicrobium zhengzhouense]|uniref:Putative 4-hydroxy-4-methyl-2-oxoglutarate aldolase n=1 Tax=Aquamicrobium zhengzhouense TaxID=2781738 RepID=A0ABS0SIQ1_9HYPH|nr:RraA family protein [Aquamicrobium zhengzhouense]MBI1622736.1 RraA family protein [Aquamicrobium zhengzhouense]